MAPRLLSEPDDQPRLLLFDLDGTLIDTRGQGTRAMAAALHEVFGLPVDLDGYSMAGRTDAQIAVELMARARQDEATTLRALPRLWPVYRRHLGERMASVPPRLYQGVAQLLDRLSRDARFVLALLTGNEEQAAWDKTRSTGIAAHFRFGAFGCRSTQRNALGPEALDRAHGLLGKRFRPDTEVWVVGDTPADIGVAKHLGARCLAVATGRHRVEDLAPHEPDALFADLTDCDAVIDALAAHNGQR